MLKLSLKKKKKNNFHNNFLPFLQLHSTHGAQMS